MSKQTGRPGQAVSEKMQGEGEVMAEFEVKCNECNEYVDADFNGPVLYVDPCEKCKEKEKDESYQQGWDEGEANARQMV